MSQIESTSNFSSLRSYHSFLYPQNGGSVPGPLTLVLRPRHTHTFVTSYTHIADVTCCLAKHLNISTKLESTQRVQTSANAVRYAKADPPKCHKHSFATISVGI